MEIAKNIHGTTAILSPKGRIDTTTAPEFDAAIQEVLPGATQLVIDLVDLAYISSAGLRALLAAQKAMSKQGKMIVRNVNDTIAEIFDVTGFMDILTLENTEAE